MDGDAAGGHGIIPLGEHLWSPTTNGVTSAKSWDRAGLDARIPLELSRSQVVCLQQPLGLFFGPEINFYLVV